MRGIVIVGLLVLTLSGCATATPSTFSTTGAITVPSGADERYDGQPCDSFRGVSDKKLSQDFSDIAAGAQVIVKDESGATVAISTLEPGTLVKDPSGEGLSCKLSFQLTEVPDADFYAIHVGSASRPDAQFTKADMQAGPIVVVQ